MERMGVPHHPLCTLCKVLTKTRLSIPHGIFAEKPETTYLYVVPPYKS